VLRNLLGITDPGELARAEAALSASRLIDLERRRLPGGYDLAHLRGFHRYILGDVYGWVGELRTVTISKGSLFCLPQHLALAAAGAFGRLAAVGRLRGLNREQFIGQLAEFLADVNALHPFREGNGRAQRAFFSQLAHRHAQRPHRSPAPRTTRPKRPARRLNLAQQTMTAVPARRVTGQAGNMIARSSSRRHASVLDLLITLR